MGAKSDETARFSSEYSFGPDVDEIPVVVSFEKKLPMPGEDIEVSSCSSEKNSVSSASCAYDQSVDSMVNKKIQ